MYVIYSELFENGRWFYGMYEQDRANEVACELNSNSRIQYCVCSEENAKDFNIKNLPF